MVHCAREVHFRHSTECLEVVRKMAAVIKACAGKIEILLSHNAAEAGDKRDWQTAYIKFAGIWEEKKAPSKQGKVTGGMRQ